MTISTEAITEEVKSNGQWVHAVQNEISRAIVGQKYLIDRMLVGVFQTTPINLVLSDPAHRTRLDVPTIAAAHGAGKGQ
jgi:hypothetical protein